MRKRVVPIITWPLRFLGRLLGLLSRPFRKLGKLGTPVRKLRGLRGKPRIVAFAVLGVAGVVVLIVVVTAVRPGPDAEKEVRATLLQYATATREKDYQTLCDELFAKNIVDGLRSAALPCEVALRNSTFETLRNPQLTVLGVEVSGDQALARVRSVATGEQPSVDAIKLVEEDDRWRIASLAEPGATADTP
jgi:hypothetical protein